MSASLLPVAQSLRVDVAPVAGMVVVAVLVVAGLVFEHRRRRRLQEGVTRLLARDRTLQATVTPCGLAAGSLAGTVATPAGDRHYGVRYGVTGPLQVALAEGQATTVECAAFEWWYEDRRTTTGKHGTSTRYLQIRRPVVAVRLPAHIPDRLTLGPESMLGRVGLTRGDHQLESSEFNRRFRVAGRDRTLVIQLLSPRLQQRLLEEFDGRSLHLAGSLLLVGGSPTHRDGSLPGVVGQLPAVRQDARRLLEAIPSRFWRAVGAEPIEPR